MRPGGGRASLTLTLTATLTLTSTLTLPLTLVLTLTLTPNPDPNPDPNPNPSPNQAAAHRCAAAAGFVTEPPLRMLKPTHGHAASEEASVSGGGEGKFEGGGDVTTGKFEPVFVFRKPRLAAPPLNQRQFQGQLLAAPLMAAPQLGGAAPPAVRTVASWPTAGGECGPDEDSAWLDALLGL